MKFSRFGFGSGLMSRDLAGRIDVDGVSRACVKMENFELLQSGAVRRRFGSRWLADLSGRPVAMQAFRWSDGMLAVVVVLDAELIIFLRMVSNCSGALMILMAALSGCGKLMIWLSLPIPTDCP